MLVPLKELIVDIIQRTTKQQKAKACLNDLGIASLPEDYVNKMV